MMSRNRENTDQTTRKTKRIERVKTFLYRLLTRAEFSAGKKKIRSKLKNDYSLWQSFYPESIGKRALKCRTQIHFDTSFSIVLVIEEPIWNEINFSIASILDQSYPNWQLIIVTGDYKPSEPNETFSIQRQNNPKINVISTNEKSPSTASLLNLALEHAKGDWLIRVRPGDTLSLHALQNFSHVTDRSNDYLLVYADEDIIEYNSKEKIPNFKPDWNQTFFYTTNYIGNACLYNTQKCLEINGFNDTYSGNEEYDFRLRYIEQIKAEQIAHIPLILFHSKQPNLYHLNGGHNALSEHLARIGVNCKPTTGPHSLRIHYTLPNSLPLASLIIPTRNCYDLLKQCIDSILTKTQYSNYEIIVIDNGSDDIETLNYFSELRKIPSVKLIRDDQPFNFSSLNNYAVEQASGDIVVLINNDIEVIEPAWLTEMVSLAIQPRFGAIGAKLLYPDNRVQHAGIVLGIRGIAGHPHKGLMYDDSGYFSRADSLCEYSAVTAACLAIRKSVYLEVNGLNEESLHVSYNDVDFCLKVKAAGYANIFTPYALLYHHESASRGYDVTPEKKKRLEEECRYMKHTWSDILERDPNYNVNLTLRYEDFSLAWPPRIDKNLLKNEQLTNSD